MQKIAPRDIFNDANFYKNLSYVLNYMHSGIIRDLAFTSSPDSVLSPDYLTLNPEDGGLETPYGAFYHQETGDNWSLTRPMNSREAFPVYFTDENYEEVPVFDGTGMPSAETLEWFNGETQATINQNDPVAIMAYSIALKGVGKLALLTIDNMACTSNLDFDEAQYSNDGLRFDKEGAYLYLEHDGLIQANGEPLQLRSPAITNDTDLWPLEFAIEGTFSRVYNDDGELTPAFLALSSKVEPELTPPPSEAPASPRVRR